MSQFFCLRISFIVLEFLVLFWITVNVLDENVLRSSRNYKLFLDIVVLMKCYGCFYCSMSSLNVCSSNNRSFIYPFIDSFTLSSIYSIIFYSSYLTSFNIHPFLHPYIFFINSLSLCWFVYQFIQPFLCQTMCFQTNIRIKHPSFKTLIVFFFHVDFSNFSILLLTPTKKKKKLTNRNEWK